MGVEASLGQDPLASSNRNPKIEIAMIMEVSVCTTSQRASLMLSEDGGTQNKPLNLISYSYLYCVDPIRLFSN